MKTLNRQETLKFLSQNFLKTIILSQTKTKIDFIQSFKDLKNIPFSSSSLKNYYILTDYLIQDDSVDCLGIFYLNFDDLSLSRDYTRFDDCVQTYTLGVQNIPPELKEFYPLDEIKNLQQRLVSAVWFGGKDDYPQEIIENLYLSSCHGTGKNYLKQFKIKNVVRLGWGFEDLEKVEVYSFRVQDHKSQPISQVLLQYFSTKKYIIPNYYVKQKLTMKKAGEIIDKCLELGESVLVHCQAGVSRSASVVLAYLMQYKKMSLIKAWNSVFVKRPIIRPNYGFAKALLDLEHELTSQTTMTEFWMSESYLNYIDYLEFMHYFYSQSGIVDVDKVDIAVDEETCNDADQADIPKLISCKSLAIDPKESNISSPVGTNGNECDSSDTDVARVHDEIGKGICNSSKIPKSREE